MKNIFIVYSESNTVIGLFNNLSNASNFLIKINNSTVNQRLLKKSEIVKTVKYTGYFSNNILSLKKYDFYGKYKDLIKKHKLFIVNNPQYCTVKRDKALHLNVNCVGINKISILGFHINFNYITRNYGFIEPYIAQRLCVSHGFRHLSPEYKNKMAKRALYGGIIIGTIIIVACTI
jgi:hypothetical protein